MMKIIELIKKFNKKKKIPNFSYPKFNSDRCRNELSLDDDEVKDFIMQLIKSLEDKLPLLIKDFENKDFKNIDEKIHLLKGTSTTLGYHGISDSLTDFYKAIKNEETLENLKIYVDDYEYYLEELKEFNL